VSVAAVASHAPAHEAHPTATGLNSRKMLFWAFLGSECMFFGSLIATYLVYRGRDQVGPHPHDIFAIPFTSFSAFVLLMSSLTMVLALAAIQRGNQRQGAIWIAATALLGMTFVGGQCYEFTEFVHQGFTLQQNLFGSTFFVLTGLHGAHVALGVVWLLALWMLDLRGRLAVADAVKVEIAGLYWHFVDIVWIAIFTLVYLIP